MASQIKVNEIIKQSGSSISIGESGDTINIGTTGDTINLAGSAYAAAGTNTPAVESYLSSDQTLSNNTATKVTFNLEAFDTNGTFSTSNNRFTPAVSGKYYIYGRLIFNDSKFKSKANLWINHFNDNKKILEHS